MLEQNNGTYCGRKLLGLFLDVAATLKPVSVQELYECHSY